MNAEWPFDQAPYAEAVTTRGVLDRTAAVLVVVHRADDRSWSFLCGETDAEEDRRVVSMADVLVIDPTLRAVADLPPGGRARRKSLNAVWVREGAE